MAANKLLKAMVFYEDGKSPPTVVPVVEYQGRAWLAPHWLSVPEQKAKTPKHIIPLDLFRFQKGGPPGCEYVVNAGIPRPLLEPEIPLELRNKYQIVERPDISYWLDGQQIPS